ncbi:MAG: hypothetical protein QM503_04925 [Bacteroidota bacterium]
MKKITTITVAIMAFVTLTFAQEKENYVMFENTRLVVKTDKFKDFGKAMAHHNSTYHAEGPYHANVWNVAVGEKAGQIIWSMGPCTFAQHDDRPDGSEHMDDWLYNVMPTISVMDGSNMWKMDDKLSYSPEEDSKSSKLSITVYDIKEWQGYRFKEILDKALQVYREKEYEWSFSTYWPQFSTNADEDVALVWGFDSWSWFDKDANFKKDFEEIHGEGSWQKFLEELRGTVKSSKDEVWVLIPELSGGK